MILTLEVTGPQAAKLGPAHRKVFSADGGTIGRLPDNDWVLPDPYVSSHHARIRHKDNTFYIEDTSTNGVFINDEPPRPEPAAGHHVGRLHPHRALRDPRIDYDRIDGRVPRRRCRSVSRRRPVRHAACAGTRPRVSAAASGDGDVLPTRCRVASSIR